MRWTEKQLVEDNSIDFLEVLSKEWERQEKAKERELNRKPYGI